MTTIHETYAPTDAPLVPFEGTREELTGGEYLGHYARPEIAVPGHIVTAVEVDRGSDDFFPSVNYFYDPELRIEGQSFVYVSDGSCLGGRWRGIASGISTADAPTPPEAPPCEDPNEPEGTRFPCTYCADRDLISACIHSDAYGECA